MDATALLKEDHDAVRALFRAFRNAGGNVASRTELFSQVRAALEIHARIEEEIFYPAVRTADVQDDVGEDLVEQAKQQHEDVDRLVAKAASIDPADGDFVKAVKKLEIEVEHHASEEEDDIFPFAREHLGASRLAALGTQLEARKKQLSTRNPHAQVV